jgi:hypothetical protein
MPTLELPLFHQGQVNAWNARTRYFALRCGRRWGKTDYGKILAGDAIGKGRNVGIFVPTYKTVSETYNELEVLLAPIKKSANKSTMVFKSVNGGGIDFWSLDGSNEMPGRGRKYDLVIIDEGAFTRPNMLDVWKKAIKPTLIDRKGRAVVMSTPNGADDENFFYAICNDPQYGFTEFHAPTAQNPYLPAEDVAKLIYDYPPLVYKQEILAEFINWGGDAFFKVEYLLNNGKPVGDPVNCEYILATIDSAVKDGVAHDGTAVCYWAFNKYGNGAPLTLLDWDVVKIDGALLIDWLPGVYANMERWSDRLKARYGYEHSEGGVYIEDKASGIILLQQCALQGYVATPIPSGITAVGKDGRAIGVSGHVYGHKVKIHECAFTKVKEYNGKTKNHLLAQIEKFYLNDKEAYKRADDLLDAFVYGPAVVFGLGEGIFKKVT